jgi:3-hydroxyacyl-[acyl-carrier-protein] dehydratase
VVPGDQVRIEVEVLKWSKRGATMQGNAYVGSKHVCEAEIKCQLVPRAARKAEHETPAMAGAATE